MASLGDASSPDELLLAEMSVYKVTPEKELDDGESCFVYAGPSPMGATPSAGGKVYDFGIRGR